MATITNFYGEIFAHPIPFELSGNACSHRCVYCFANARQSARVQDAKAVTSQIKNIPKGSSWIARRILEGFPVCLSNSTDPFSKTNEALTESILELASLAKMRIFFQTKGGERAYPMIKAYGLPSVVYITITTPHDDISRRIEPGAPVSSERIDLIRKLTADGHRVIVGVNPMVPEWLGGEGFPDLEPFLQTLKDAGASSFVLSPLVVRRTHEAIFAKRDFAGVDVRKYNGWRAVTAKILELHKRWAILGYQQPLASSGWDCVEEIYQGYTMPTTQGFINLCLKRYGGADGSHFQRLEKLCPPEAGGSLQGWRTTPGLLHLPGEPDTLEGTGRKDHQGHRRVPEDLLERAEDIHKPVPEYPL